MDPSKNKYHAYVDQVRWTRLTWAYLTELCLWICEFKRFGYQEDYFGFKTVDLYVWRVAFRLKLDVWTSLERSSAQVMQKVPKIMAKWSPRGAFGSTLGTQNDPKAYKISVLGTSILHTDFRGSPGSHCGRNRLRIRCQKQCLDCAGASGSHVGRFTKNLPGGYIFKGFWRRFGCQIELVGSLWAHDGTFFRRWVRSRCRGYGTRRTSAENQVTSGAKVYLSDKSYD